MDYTQFEGHTPGPWEWTGNSLDQKESPYGEVISNEVSCGAYCLGGSWSSHLKDADKALIEAAPALLADNAQLRAENERLRAALEACITEQGAYCLQHQELPGLMGRRLHAITDTARAALGKEAA